MENKSYDLFSDHGFEKMGSLVDRKGFVEYLVLLIFRSLILCLSSWYPLVHCQM